MENKPNINKIAHIIWRMSQRAVLAECLMNDLNAWGDDAPIDIRERHRVLAEEVYDMAMDDIELLMPHELYIKEHYPFLAGMVEANMNELERAREMLEKGCEHHSAQSPEA